jgi:hypothetical protein
MIVKRDSGYHVVSKKGKNLGGPYKSKDQAVKRLQQVEYFKHKKGSVLQAMIEKSATSYGMPSMGGSMNYYQNHKMQAAIYAKQYRATHQMQIRKSRAKYRRQINMGQRIPRQRMRVGTHYVYNRPF